MQCPCGGATDTKELRRTHQGVLIARVELDHCPHCTRVGDARLFRLDRKTGRVQMTYRGHPSGLPDIKKLT